MGHRLLPAVLEHALGPKIFTVSRPEMLSIRLAFFWGGESGALLDGLLQRCLNVEAVSHQDQDGDDGHHHHHTGENPDDEEEDGKRQIDQGGDGGRRENSRTDSNSCKCLAKAPVDAGLDSIFMPITFGKILADNSTSDFLPAISMK